MIDIFLGAVNTFWSCWSKEYSPSLQNHRKCFKKQQNLQRRDLLLVVKDSKTRSYWPVAPVLQVYPGKDDVVISAKVKLQNTELVQPSRNCSNAQIRINRSKISHFTG